MTPSTALDVTDCRSHCDGEPASPNTATACDPGEGDGSHRSPPELTWDTSDARAFQRPTHLAGSLTPSTRGTFRGGRGRPSGTDGSDDRQGTHSYGVVGLLKGDPEEGSRDTADSWAVFLGLSCRPHERVGGPPQPPLRQPMGNPVLSFLQSCSEAPITAVSPGERCRDPCGTARGLYWVLREHSPLVRGLGWNAGPGPEPRGPHSLGSFASSSDLPCTPAPVPPPPSPPHSPEGARLLPSAPRLCDGLRVPPAVCARGNSSSQPTPCQRTFLVPAPRGSEDQWPPLGLQQPPRSQPSGADGAHRRVTTGSARLRAGPTSVLTSERRQRAKYRCVPQTQRQQHGRGCIRGERVARRGLTPPMRLRLTRPDGHLQVAPSCHCMCQS